MIGRPVIVVAGGGALGLACAAALQHAGAQVTLVRPGGPSASSVAAGMLAPAMEALLDEVSPSFALMRAARDLWPAFAARHGIALDRAGAWFLGAQAPAHYDRLVSLGGEGRLAPAPAGFADGTALFTPEDWRLDAASALTALEASLTRLGGRTVQGALAGFQDGAAWLTDGRRLPAQHLVLAPGYAPALAAVAPEMTRLRPIKGQILRAAAGGGEGLTVRAAGVYVCRDAAGVTVGATMEAGAADLNPTALADELRLRAAALSAALANLAFQVQVGVRAESPDGVPLIGRSRAGGVLLAAGARRNGWLLAPLAAQIVTALAGDAEPDPLGAAFDPGRLA